MPRRNRRDAVAERANQMLTEQAQRRREAAQRGAQTRRQRREQQEGEVLQQPEAESGTQGNVARNRRERVHQDLLTVAIRGEFANRMRALSDSTGMSLAKLLKDALLVYEGDVAAGYEPGTNLGQWNETVAANEGAVGDS